jgi:hypothetical protein
MHAVIKIRAFEASTPVKLILLELSAAQSDTPERVTLLPLPLTVSY